MDGIDRAKIDAIILRESGNSNFMKQQRKRDAAVDERIAKMKKGLDEHLKVGPHTWAEAERGMQPEIDQLMKKRKRLSTCVVVDMDAFYMSCELLSRPDLNDKPAVVGRGMVLTSNYVARRYGVRSAMAGWIADKLVEELSNGTEKLVHVPSNFDLYTRKAHEVRSVLAEYDPNMRAYSLDEAYLDLEPYLSLRLGKGLKHEEVVAALNKTEQSIINNDEDNDDEEDGSNEDTKPVANDEDASLDHLSPDVALKATAAIVEEMRKKVINATGGLTCSAGLANNFMLSKIASDLNKPNGQCIVGPTNKQVLDFIRPMKVRKVGGIGRVTEKILNAFGIWTVQELYDKRALVQFIFDKQATAKFLLQRSIGWSNSDSNSNDDEEESSLGQKGISKERTFRAGRTWGEVNIKLGDIAVLLSEAMKRKNLFAHTITLKVKLSTFDVLSRAKSMARGVYIQTAEEMIPIVSKILSDLKNEHKGAFNVRLLGIRCSNFREESDSRQKQLDAFLVKKPAKPTCMNIEPASTDVVALPKKMEGQEEIDEKQERNLIVSPYRKGSVGKSSPLVRQNISSHTWRPSTPVIASDEISSTVQTVCPICSKTIAGDNNDLNRHVDACLNAGTVAELVEQSNAEADERSNKKRRVLKDFFPS